MLYATDATVQDSGLSADEAAQAARDATAVYEFIRDNPWTDGNAIATWAQQDGGIGTVRLNSALAMLVRMGRIIGVDAGPPVPAPAPAPAAAPKAKARPRAKAKK